MDIKSEVAKSKAKTDAVYSEVSKFVLGQPDIIKKMIIALASDGHVLVEGNPGLAKTLLVLTFAQVARCKFGRIQFTPDLLPADVTGTNMFKGTISGAESGGTAFEVVRGPIFANFVLADEINRAPPKVQSALLEAMQEKKVTIGNNTLILPKPFFVFATQNPIEQAGTYVLPAAQLDRFMFKIKIDYPDFESEKQILDRNITLFDIKDFGIKQIVTAEDILKMQYVTKQIYLSKQIKDYIVSLIEATRKPDKYGIETGKYIELGSSPRGSISIYIASKAAALISGNNFVTPDIVKSVAHDALRHRITVNYEGQAEEVTSDKIIDEILDKVPLP